MCSSLLVNALLRNIYTNILGQQLRDWPLSDVCCCVFFLLILGPTHSFPFVVFAQLLNTCSSVSDSIVFILFFSSCINIGNVLAS